ncbi:MAG: membrane-bound PQQ-dependent dehydrogenase, glucose/quinate/shikimate family [Oceanicaulis sp.]
MATRAAFGSNWAGIVLGAILALIGISLLIGGVWLAAVGGSWYYLLAGAGLTAAGALMVMGRKLGALIYLGVFAFTVLWAFWEVGLQGWPLLPRLVGPTVLAVLTLLVLPTLRGGPSIGWAGAGGGAAGVAAAGLALVAFTIIDHDPTVIGMMPAAEGDMDDPSFQLAGEDWPSYGATDAARRWSPLDQIHTGNVQSLERAWVFETGDMPTDAISAYGAENTPIKIADALYVCSATNHVFNLDPATGEQRWSFDPEITAEWIPYTAACRGLVYYEVEDAGEGDACATRIFVGTLRGRVIALDAKTGERCQGFGENGEVRLSDGMGEVEPGMVAMSSPPTVVRDVIVTGHQVTDGVKLDAPSGVIKGFNAVTGELEWAWDMINEDWEAEPPEGEHYARGTPNMWTTASGDDELGLVYMPMGNSAGDYLSEGRAAAENEYSTSLVAINVETGEPVWHFTTVYKDVWDYDLGAQATLIDYPSKDGDVPAVVLPSKQGDIYIMDRRNGALIFEAELREAPQGGVELDERTEVQPFSTFHTLARPPLEERDMWGISPIDQMFCRIQYQRAAYEGIYTPPTADRHFIQYPGYNGGTDWGGVSIDEARGLIIANYNDMPNHNRLIPRAEIEGADGSHEGLAPQEGAPYGISINAGWRMPWTGMICKEPPYGGIRAIDIQTGATVWDRRLGTARANGPFGLPSRLPVTIGTPNNGGPVVTAGGLIFIAAATDNLIRAYDTSTGERIWTDVLPGGGQATPMTYMHEGRQYVVIYPGGHHFMETPIADEVIAYALPESGARDVASTQ